MPWEIKRRWWELVSYRNVITELSRRFPSWNSSNFAIKIHTQSVLAHLVWSQYIRVDFNAPYEYITPVLFFSLQDDRNQMITTNVWVRQVSTFQWIGFIILYLAGFLKTYLVPKITAIWGKKDTFLLYDNPKSHCILCMEDIKSLFCK